MDKVKLGIIGYGNMGSSHAKNILDGLCPEIELTAIAEVKENRREIARNTCGENVLLYNSGDDLIKDKKVDAIIIAVPHYDHPRYVIMGLENGLHVMCEKPAGVHTKHVKEMNEAAKKSDKIFAMMFNQRTNHVYRKMRELVHSGKYGEIRRTNWLITDWYRTQFYYNSGEWRATWSGEGGGVLLNQAPHQLDLWQWICGMPVKVHAKLSYGKWHDIEVEDDVSAYVEYANGATGVFITSTGDPHGTNRFEIQMDKAKLVCTGNDLEVWEFDQTEQEFSKNCTSVYDSLGKKKLEIETDGKNEQHVGVLNAFAGAILRGEPLVAQGYEGINGLTISNAMHLSSWLDREVTIPFDDELFYSELMKRVASSAKKKNVCDVLSSTEGSYGAK